MEQSKEQLAVTEGNKLIAEFMGAEIKDNTYCFHLGNPAYQIQIEQMSFEDIKRLRYHTSWDWLMNVVEKIGRFSNWNYSFNVSQSKPVDAIIFDNDYKYTSSGKRFVCQSYSLIEAVWLTVVEFIQWYNNQNLNQ